jgi:K+-sensing histidine kinase KdpD
MLDNASSERSRGQMASTQTLAQVPSSTKTSRAFGACPRSESSGPTARNLSVHNAPARMRDAIMVCLSVDDPVLDQELLRKGSRDAEEMHANWFAVYVDVPKVFGLAKRRKSMLKALKTATELGAEALSLKGHDVARALLDFGWENSISKIIVGRSRPGLLHRLFRRCVSRNLLKYARDLEIEVVGYRRPSANVDARSAGSDGYDESRSITSRRSDARDAPASSTMSPKLLHLRLS